MCVTLHKKRFAELTTDELYELLRIRNDVFVVEQNCVYQDLDYDDQAAIHLWLTVKQDGDSADRVGKVVALCRVCPAGTHMPQISIGRVITTIRGKGYGRQIMLQAIETAKEYFSATTIDIEAQEYARGFYEGVGFCQSSDVFMLDGIPHIKMTWKENKVEHHPLQPFLPSNGQLLMLGSFPPQQKRWAKDFFFYYPNFTNDMWRVLGTVFFDDPLYFVDSQHKTYRKDEIVSFLTNKGIGIYDTACAVRRLQDNASDKFLEVVTPTDIEGLLAKMPDCRNIVTTGQKATVTLCEHFGIKQPKMGGSCEFLLSGETFRLFRMPSTSRAYPLALSKKAEAYRRMFEQIGCLGKG